MNPFWIENGLHPRIIDILSGKGITAFTPVQGEAFLPIMKGRDVIGCSRTGTGTFFGSRLDIYFFFSSQS